MDKETPQPGQRWRDFKGSEYVIIATAHHSAFNEQLVIYAKEFQYLPIIAQHTKTLKKLFIRSLKQDVKAFAAEAEDIATAKACPLDIFMEILSSPSGTQSSNYYRFERV